MRGDGVGKNRISGGHQSGGGGRGNQNLQNRIGKGGNYRFPKYGLFVVSVGNLMGMIERSRREIRFSVENSDEIGLLKSSKSEKNR